MACPKAADLGRTRLGDIVELPLSSTLRRWRARSREPWEDRNSAAPDLVTLPVVRVSSWSMFDPNDRNRKHKDQCKTNMLCQLYRSRHGNERQHSSARRLRLTSHLRQPTLPYHHVRPIWHRHGAGMQTSNRIKGFAPRKNKALTPILPIPKFWLTHVDRTGLFFGASLGTGLTAVGQPIFHL